MAQLYQNANTTLLVDCEFTSRDVAGNAAVSDLDFHRAPLL
jgi:hypothetical protein